MVYYAEQPSNAVGMVANSGHEEGAWAFLQFYLQNGYRNSRGVELFPTRIDRLEERAEKIMEPLYQYDENGEKEKDSDGNVLTFPKRSIDVKTGVEITWDPMTPDEVNSLRKVLESIDFTPRSAQKETIIAIISEETQPFFNGDKTAEETAEIIQNRVWLLLQESQ